jgi:hypothetical protein
MLLRPGGEASATRALETSEEEAIPKLCGATAMAAMKPTVNTRAGDEGVWSELMQHEFRLCSVWEGGQQACAGRELLAMIHMTPGRATEASATAIRPAARLFLNRTIRSALIAIQYTSSAKLKKTTVTLGCESAHTQSALQGSPRLIGAVRRYHK